MHGGGGVYVAGGMCGRGHAWQGACVAGGMHGRGACVAGETTTAADGTHPTGMHSCLYLFQKRSSQSMRSLINLLSFRFSFKSVDRSTFHIQEKEVYRTSIVNMSQIKYIIHLQIKYKYTGRERLIRTRLIRSATLFEVTVNIWQESYHFMFKMHS